MKMCSFDTFMHIVIRTTCMMDLFNILVCGENVDICIFYYISREIKCYLDRQAGLRGPGPWHVAPFFIHLLHFLFILPFVLVITKISHRVAMRKSIHDVVDAQALGSRHQTSMLHYWIFYMSHNACYSEKFKYCSENSAWCCPSNYWYYVVLSNQYAILNL